MYAIGIKGQTPRILLDTTDPIKLAAETLEGEVAVPVDGPGGYLLSDCGTCASPVEPLAAAPVWTFRSWLDQWPRSVQLSLIRKVQSDPEVKLAYDRLVSENIFPIDDADAAYLETIISKETQ
ncbi:hypothetical protein EOE18_15325 [Novosphingobium umbonatum]|uniref:Uncharacterized protein n=1 Tax=Novosphingobium umbonatum TaxID=1908524 RepID=A0A3S2USA7_9SPHN|nr:hypothetical protein [Novosphingobium umbonatum]RVU03492.1 hypothetical protein EOE18_15325 [Novosphingobium umbonatum]